MVPLYHWLFNVFDFYSEELYILLLPSAHFWNVKKGTREVKTIRNYDCPLDDAHPVARFLLLVPSCHIFLDICCWAFLVIYLRSTITSDYTLHSSGQWTPASDSYFSSDIGMSAIMKGIDIWYFMSTMYHKVRRNGMKCNQTISCILSFHSSLLHSWVMSKMKEKTSF